MAWKSLLITGLLIALILLIRWIRRPEWQKIVARSKYRKLTRYIVAQAKHETGNYTSLLYKKANSLFGIKTFKGATAYPSKEGGYYRVYPNLSESARDLIAWYDRNKMPTEVKDVNEFAGALKIRGYFTDKLDNYIGGLNRFL